MSVDGFLTFLGLLVAAYALLDDVSKLKLRLHAKRQLVLLAFSFSVIAVLVLLKEPTKHMPAHFPPPISEFVVWADGTAIGAGGVAFLAIFVWAGFAALLYFQARPTVGSLRKLDVLVERLLAEGRHLELVDVVKPYIPLIGRVSARQTRIQRLHDWLSAGGPFRQSISDMFVIDDEPPSRLKSLCRAVFSCAKCAGRLMVRPLAHLVPARRGASQAATDLEISLLGSSGLSSFLVHSKADFILNLMSLNRLSTDGFSERIIKDMMNAKDSHFFRELKILDIRSPGGGYPYESQAPLLRGLILDSKVAHEHGLWRPVGEEVLRVLREDTDYRHRLLEKPYDDNEPLYNDVVFCSLKFFDIMISAAAARGVEDHMWLMYMSIISKELVDLHCGRTIEYPDFEFPTLAMRLLWEITCCQQSWIELYRKLDSDNYHVRSENLRGWDNASIVMWAVRDYASVIREISASRCLPERFKIDRWSSYVRLISQVPNDQKHSFLKTSLIKEVVEPDHYSALGDISAALSRIHFSIDHVIRGQCEELSAALSA